MASTRKVAITRTWTKVSDNNCLISSEGKKLIEIDFYVGSTLEDAHVTMLIDGPTNCNFGDSFWCRLTSGSPNSSENIIVIK